MAESNETVKPNGIFVEVAGEEDGSIHKRKGGHRTERQSETLYEVLQTLIAAILFAEPGKSDPLLHRIRTSVSQYAPFIPEASRNTGRDVLLWTRRGSPVRALFAISVGTITLVSLTGLLVFMLFFLAATINAIVILLLVYLVAAAGFLALFFISVTAIYIGALSIAIFAISSATFWAVVAILITTGWIGFFWTLWLATRKSFGLAKHSLSVTGSTISTYTAARHARHLPHKGSD